MNLLWSKSKGWGTKIAVVDDGVNLNHQELKQVQPILSYDLENQTLTSHLTSEFDAHGTKVAGIIFAGLYLSQFPELTLAQLNKQWYTLSVFNHH